MYKLSHGVKGYISLILCIILLPMMTYSSMIIDASRLQSLRTGIQSAGDLALNAALSEYDFLLEDMYGLFANTKEGEIEDAVKLYFAQTIQNSLADYSFDQTKTEQYVDNIYDIFYNSYMNGEKIDEDDVVNFITATMEDFSLDGVYGSALASPAVLKEQIVEYMKYKGPVSIVTSLVGKIKVILESTAQLDSCASQVKYEEAITDLEDYAVKSYESIDAEYNQLAQIFNQLIKPESGDKKSLSSMLDHSKGMLQKGAAFYLLQDASPFSGDKPKPRYNELLERAKKEEDEKDHFTALPENYDAEHECEDNWENELQESRDVLGKLCDKINQLIGDFKNQIGSCEYTPVENGEPFFLISGAAFGLPTCAMPSTDVTNVRSTNSVNNDNMPTYANLVGDYANWYAPFRSEKETTGIADNDDGVNRQLKYCSEIVNAQNLLAGEERQNGIVQFLKFRYQLMLLKQQLEEKLTFGYQEEVRNSFIHEITHPVDENDPDSAREYDNPENKDAGALQADLDAAWKEFYYNSGYAGYNEFLMQANAYLEYMAEIEVQLSGANLDYVSYPPRLSHENSYMYIAENFHGKFNEYATPYYQDGLYSLASLKYLLDAAHCALVNASEQMTKLIEQLEEMDRIKKEWDENLKKVDSGTAKVSLKQSQEAVVNLYNLDDAQKLQTLLYNMSNEIDIKQKECNQYSVLGTTLETMFNTAYTFAPGPTGETATDGIFHDRFSAYMHSDATKAAVARATKEMRRAWMLGKSDSAYKVMMIAYTSNSLNMRKLNNYPKQGDAIFDRILKGTDAEAIAQNAMKEGKLLISGENFGTSNGENWFAELRLLDGIKEEAGGKEASIDTIKNTKEKVDKANKDLKEAKEKGTEAPDAKLDVVDADEKFVMTLYSIWQSAEMAKSKEKATTKQDDDYKQLNTMAEDSAKSAKEGGGSDDEKKKEKEDPVSEKYDEFLKEIEAYTGAVNETNTPVGQIDVPEIKEGSEAKNTKSGGVMESAKGVLNMLANIMESLAEDAYLEEYFTEMFSCRTDAIEKEGRDPVSYLSGYTTAEGSTKQINTNTEWFGHETEYILWGKPKMSENYFDTDALLFGFRFAMNVVYAFTATDIRDFAQLMATSICIGPAAVAIPIVKTCIIIGLAIAESGVDLWFLHNGEDVAIYKDDRTFVCSPKGFAARMKGNFREVAIEQAKSMPKSLAKKAEDKIGEIVDQVNEDVQKKAVTTIGEYQDKFDDLIDEYATGANEEIQHIITDVITQPILDAVTNLQAQLMAAAQYQPAEVLENLVTNALDTAMDQIKNSVDSLPESVAKDIALQVLEEKGLDIYNMVLDQVNECFCLDDVSNVYSLLTEKVDDLMTNVETMRDNINQGVENIIEGFKDKITEAAKTIADEAKDGVKKVGDQAATNVKEFANKRLDTMADKLGTSLSSKMEAIPDITDKDKRENEIYSAADEETEAGAVTLNYKEYLKIFMFIRLAVGNQDNMLKRAAVLIQCNIRHPANKAVANESFEICKANTLFSITSVLKMKTLFPWTAESNTDGLTGESSISFAMPKIGENFMRINYCGVNGY